MTTSGRPGRTRSEKAWTAILEATREELAANGFDRLSIDRIAAAAGVGKQTVYRWYPSKSELVAECILRGHVLTPTLEMHDTGDLRRDITSWVQEFAAASGDPLGAALVRSATAAAAENPEIAARYHEVTAATGESIVTRLRAGVAAGQLAVGTPLTTITEVLLGALLYRLLTRQEITSEFASELVDLALGPSTTNT